MPKFRVITTKWLIHKTDKSKNNAVLALQQWNFPNQCWITIATRYAREE